MNDLRSAAILVLEALDDSRHRRVIVGGLLLLAFALRLLAAFVLPLEFRFQSDAALYVSIADNLLDSGMFGAERGVPYALVPPLYPLFVASIFSVAGRTLMAVRVIQAALGTLIVLLVYLVGAETGSKRVAVVSALLSAFYPVWIIWPSLVLTETLYTALLLGFTWYLMRSLLSSSVWQVLGAGALFGLALLTREVLFAFPLVLPLALWWSRASLRHALRYIIVFVAATLVTVSPWLARNYSTFGAVFFTDRTEAIRYQLTGSGYLSPRYQYMADESASPPPLVKPPDFAERFGHPGEWISAAHALDDPATYLRHLGNRLVEIWLHPNGLQSLPDSPVVRVPYIAFQVIMVALSGWSLLIGIRQRNVPVGTFTLLLGYVAFTGAFLTMPNPRYTLPVLPLIFISAVWGVSTFCASARRGSPTPEQASTRLRES